MEQTKKELIDFISWYANKFEMKFTDGYKERMVDEYLKSINSDHQDKGVTLEPNEGKEKICQCVHLNMVLNGTKCHMCDGIINE